MGTLPIFVLVTLAILFGLFVMVLTTFLGPKKPSPEKLAPYECGIQEIQAPNRTLDNQPMKNCVQVGW